MKKTIAVLAALVWAIALQAQTYSADSLVVRGILDANGLTSVNVGQVTFQSGGAYYPPEPSEPLNHHAARDGRPAYRAYRAEPVQQSSEFGACRNNEPVDARAAEP